MQQRRPPFIAALTTFISFLLLAVYAFSQEALHHLPRVGKHLGHHRSSGIGHHGTAYGHHSGRIANTNQNPIQRRHAKHLSSGISNTKQNQIGTNTNQNPIQQGQAEHLPGGIPNTNQNPIQRGQADHLSGGIPSTNQNQIDANTNQNQNPIQQGQAKHLSSSIPNKNQIQIGTKTNEHQNQNPIQQGQTEHLLGGIPNTNQNQQGQATIANTNQNQVQAGNSNSPISTGNSNQNQSCCGNSSVDNMKGEEGTNASAALVQEFLLAHNLVRKKFNEPPFMWDDKLALYAQTYAAKLYNECKMIHSNGCYGENIFWGLNPHWTPSEAVKFWYEEYKHYDFRTHTCAIGKKCGHFTQMVWRDSLRLGCAVFHCRPGAGMLIICEYDPPGNYENENPFDNNNAKQQ